MIDKVFSFDEYRLRFGGGSNSLSESRFLCCSGVRVKRDAAFKFEISNMKSLCRPPRELCLCLPPSTWHKNEFTVLAPKIPKPAQACPSLPKAAQGCPSRSPRGGGGGQLRTDPLWALCASLHPIAPINAFFQEKKDCLFFGPTALELVALGRESTQINPSRFKYKPNAGQCRPKNESTTFPFCLCAFASLCFNICVSSVPVCGQNLKLGL
jgi:hypothetical protein